MGVYLYPSGVQKELQNAYIGTTSGKKIYVGATKIRPSGWKPGANTIGYRKLDGNANDSSGNGYNGTETNISYTTLASGIQVATYQKGSSKIQLPSMGAYNQFTTSIWVQYTSTSKVHGRIWTFDGTYNGQTTMFQPRRNGGNPYVLMVSCWNGSTETTANLGVNGSTWTNLVVTFNNGVCDGYINGSYVASCNSGFNDGYVNMNTNGLGSDYAGTYHSRGGYMSEAILDGKLRTASEVSDYYNQTKANYGL